MNTAVEAAALEDDDNPRKEAALELARRGFSILAVDKRSKEPDRLLAPNGFPDATRDAEVISGWYDAKPHANIGIACGPDYGVIVLDIDCKNGAPGFDTWTRLDIAPVTLSATTPSGGLHLYFQHPKVKLFPTLAGVDIKGSDGGGYVLAPPSSIPGYGEYCWSDPEIPLAQFPEELLRQLRVDEKGHKKQRPAKRRAAKGPAASLRIPEGERHDRLLELGGAFRGKGLEEDEIEALLWLHAERDFDPPFSRDRRTDVREIARMAHWYAGKPPNGAHVASLPVFEPPGSDTGAPRIEPVERLIRIHSQLQEDQRRLQRLARELDRAALLQAAPIAAVQTWLRKLDDLEESWGEMARELDLGIELLERRSPHA
jgi:hypothetical protein